MKRESDSIICCFVDVDQLAECGGIVRQGEE